MNRSIVTTMVLGASLMSSAAMHAATRSIPATVPATHTSHVKEVRFSLRNDSTSMIELRAGNREFVLRGGETMDVQLPVGVNVVAEKAPSDIAAGTVLVQVASLLGDATVAVK